MPQLADLELPFLPIDQQAFADGPDPFMLAARAQHPWLARSDFGVVVTDYEACAAILMQDARLKTPGEHIVAIMGGEGTNWARFQRECLIARDGDDHVRIRTAINRAFLPRAVRGYGERIIAVITRLLDIWAPLGAFDFAAFAARFPVAVMFGLVGVPAQRIEEVRDWLEIVGQSFSLDPALFPRIDRAFDALWAFVDDLLLRHVLAENGAGLLDALVLAERDGTLSATEARDLLLFLFVAGYDTSKNQLGQIVNQLVDRPEHWLRCAEDRVFCDRVVDEALRHSGVATSYRNVAEALVWRDTTIEAGTMLIFPMGIVGRFSGPFADPATFDPARANANRHTAFGRGMHLCLGQFLAKLQISEGLHLIARRLRNPRRNGDVTWRPFPGVWGPSHLPIAFEPNDS